MSVLLCQNAVWFAPLDGAQRVMAAEEVPVQWGDLPFAKPCCHRACL